MIVSELPPMEITAEDRANAKTDMHALAVNRRSLLSFCTFLATRERQLTAALARVRDLEQELATLRTAAEGMEKALDGLMDLFCDPSPFYIKKLGSPITNGDQDRIDNAFVVGQEALAAYRKAVGR